MNASEAICEWSDMLKSQCGHCTGDLKKFEDSLSDPEIEVVVIRRRDQ